MSDDEIDKEIARRRFIAEHHHLINPLRYSVREIHSRDALLLRRQWDRAERRK